METKTDNTIALRAPTLAPGCIADRLNVAHVATRLLQREGVVVHAAIINGARRPLLIVDRLPNGTKGSQKQRYPNGQGGTTIVEAVTHYGCQLEWMHDVYSDAQAARIKAVLEQDAPKAVANGCH